MNISMLNLNVLLCEPIPCMEEQDRKIVLSKMGDWFVTSQVVYFQIYRTKKEPHLLPRYFADNLVIVICLNLEIHTLTIYLRTYIKYSSILFNQKP